MPYNVELPNGMLIEGIPDDVPKDEARRRILEKFPDLAPKPTFGEYAKDIPKAIGRGAVGMLETAGIGASALLPEEYEQKARAGIQSLAEPAKQYLAAKSPELEQSVSSQLASGLGSTLPFFLAGPAGAVGRLGAAGLGIAAGAGEARMGAEQAGATPEQRAKATLLGAPTGLLDIIAPEIGPLKGLFTTALARGGVEGLTEASQKVAQNMIAKGLYNPEQDVLAGSGQEGAYGAGVGALASLLVDVTLGRRARSVPSKPAMPGVQPVQEPPAPMPEAPVAPTPAAEEVQRPLDQITELPRQPQVQLTPPTQAALPAPQMPLLPSPAPEPPTGLREDEYAATQQAIREAELADVTKGVKPLKERDVMPRPEELVAMGFPPPPPKAPKGMKPSENPDNIGFAGLDENQKPLADLLSSGAKPFPTKVMADKIKEQYGDYKAIKVAGGFVLSPKTEADFARDKEAAKKFGRFQSGTPGMPVSAHEFIVARGGLNPAQRADTDFPDRNPRVGNRFLFSNRGMSLDQAAQALYQEGFIPKPTESAAAAAISQGIRGRPVYTPQGYETISNLEREKEVKEQMKAEPPTMPEADVYDYLYSDDFYRQPLSHTRQVAEDYGIDFDDVAGNIARKMPEDAPQEQYENAVKNAISKNIRQQVQENDQAKYALISADPNQLKNGEAHARDFGGHVVYQNGDIGLVQGFSRISGDPVYMPFKGEYRVGKDIDSIQTNPLNLSDKQRQELAQAKQQVISEEGARQETVVKFDNGIGFSKDIDPRLAGVLRGWKQMLGIPNNIYITTSEDARANVKNFTGPYRRIGSALLDENASGSMRSLGNGEYYIVFNKSTSTGKMLEILSHELGHIHEKIVFDNASPELKQAIVDDYKKWVASNKGKTAREHLEGMRAKRMARHTANKSDPRLMSSDLRSYWHNFDEWYADQVSKWATTQEKPLSIVEQFFAKLGAALRRFYSALRGQKYLPTETFKRYMNEVTSVSRSNAAPIASDDQIALFARQDTGAPQAMLGKAEKEPVRQRSREADAGMEILSGMGRQVAEPEPGYLDKVRQSWNNVRDNPTLVKEQSIGTFRRYADWIQIKAFSSDAALNNHIRHSIMESMMGQEEKIGILLNASLSQTAHSDAIAGLFLTEGNIRWSPELHKWEGVKDENNILRLSKQLDEMAAKHGLTKEEAELIAHTAFEARRTQGLIQANQQMQAQAEAMQAEAARIRGRSPVAASELIDKANRLMAKQKVIHMTPEQIQGGMTQFQLFPELKDVADTWNGIRQNGIKVMVDTGLYTEEEADNLMANADYVPFYREDQIEEGKGPKEFLRSLSVQADKRLKGSQKPVNDIFDNMVRWTQYAVNRGVRNRSAQALVDTAQSVGLAEQVADPKAGENVVRVWKNGQEQYFNMADPMFVDAFRGLESVSIPTIKFFSKFADILRNSVVLFPLFSVSQLTQDSFAAMFSSGLKPQHALSIPFRAVKEFIQTLRGKSDTHQILKNVGAVGVRDFSSAIIRSEAEILAGLKKDKGLLDGIKRYLGNFAMAADNAVRQATYEAAMAQGMSRAEAMEKAFEIFNVRRRGSSRTLALMGQVIPFFNAYLTAQNVAYRTLTGVGTSPTERKAALQTLTATTASVMALSVLYAMLMGGDDDYENKATPTRDRLLMIPGMGGFGLPLRADAFILPKVLAEHTYHMLTDDGMTDGAKFRASLSSAIMNSIFSPTPIPQAIKPVAEVALNYDFFQQKPLVGIYQSKKEIDRQFEDSTSEFAKLFAKVPIKYSFEKNQWEGLMSPIAVDHVVRGMFGSFGGAFLQATNPLLAAMSGATRPDMSIRDAANAIPSASAFISKEYEIGLRKDFYALKDVTDRAAATLSDMKQRSPQEIREYMEDPVVRQRVGMAPFVNRIATQLTDIRKKISTITNIEEKDMSSERKEEMIKNLHEQERQLLRNIDLRRLREMAQM